MSDVAKNLIARLTERVRSENIDDSGVQSLLDDAVILTPNRLHDADAMVAAVYAQYCQNEPEGIDEVIEWRASRSLAGNAVRHLTMLVYALANGEDVDSEINRTVDWLVRVSQ